jgi:hypothetical protein
LNPDAPGCDQLVHTANSAQGEVSMTMNLKSIGFAVCVVALSSQGAFAEMLFKVVTVKDEILIGLNDKELGEMGGDAAGIAKALASKGSLGVWQYSVQQAKDGERQVAPLHKVGLMAHDSVRVEPYKQPFKVVPHE